MPQDSIVININHTTIYLAKKKPFIREILDFFVVLILLVV